MDVKEEIEVLEKAEKIMMRRYTTCYDCRWISMDREHCGYFCNPINRGAYYLDVEPLEAEKLCELSTHIGCLKHNRFRPKKKEE